MNDAWKNQCILPRTCIRIFLLGTHTCDPSLGKLRQEDLKFKASLENSAKLSENKIFKGLELELRSRALAYPVGGLISKPSTQGKKEGDRAHVVSDSNPGFYDGVRQEGGSCHCKYSAWGRRWVRLLKHPMTHDSRPHQAGLLSFLESHENEPGWRGGQEAPSIEAGAGTHWRGGLGGLYISTTSPPSPRIVEETCWLAPGSSFPDCGPQVQVSRD